MKYKQLTYLFILDCSPAKDNDLRLELLLVVSTVIIVLVDIIYNYTHTIFQLSRHGDRLPEEYEVYPKDPEKNTGNYEKVGYGQLTEVSSSIFN